MAGLIKGQILKHLSKFVKNLNPSQIQLSAMKGEGELTDLELNEVVLTELLELPVWIRLTKASCNRAAIRIQWTKLKTVPIQLNLDEIRVNLETCEELRTGSGSSSSNLSFSQPTGAYGFTDKVVDGITVSVNLVHVTLSSLAFTASFQMSRILLESKTPAWQKANLQMTRLKDADLAEVLIFKEISWQTVRIEAKSTVNQDLTPLRLITNQARCRITIKKRICDSAILGCRLVLILDDLLWVLTDDQLKAALHFMDSISGLVKKTTTTNQKAKAARKLENQGIKINLPKSRNSGATSAAARTFQKYDVVETSYHFYSDRIDLHFCDDPGGGRSSHPDLAEGGAFQVSLSKLQIDYYPYHLARGDRKHWVRYTDASPHKAWLLSNLASFDTRLLDVLLSGRNHKTLSRVGKAQVGLGHLQGGGGATAGGQQRAEPEDDAMRDLVVNQLSRLMTENVVVRLHDLSVWCVSCSSSPTNAGSKLQELVKGDQARLHLPQEFPLLHLELTSFYYPGDLDFPLPPPVLMVHLNPVTVWLDVPTLVWINAFMLNLQKSVQSLQASLELEQSESYTNIKLEVLMPRVICGARMPQKIESPLKPDFLQIQASKISLANYRSLETGSRADLATVLDLFQRSPLFFGADFPSKPGDVNVVCQKFINHATGDDAVREAPSMNTAFKKDLLWTDARDMWYVLVDSLWAEFVIPKHPGRPVPLLDALPLAAWVYAKPRDKKVVVEKSRPHRKLLKDYYSDEKNQPSHKGVDGIHVLAHTSRLASLQLDHHQLIFLLRLAESLAELSAFISADTSNIDPTESVVAVGAVLPQLDISILLPPPRIIPEPTCGRQEEHRPTSEAYNQSDQLTPRLPLLAHQLSSPVIRTPSPQVLSSSLESAPPPPASSLKITLESTTELALTPTLDSAETSSSSIHVDRALQPVIDHSDPLSLALSSSQHQYNKSSSDAAVHPAVSTHCTAASPGVSSPLGVGVIPSSSSAIALPGSGSVSSGLGSLTSVGSLAGLPPPSLKLPPAMPSPALSNGRSSRTSSGITSSFNSLMGSMGFSQKNQEGVVYLSGTRSPDLDTLSVRSDESGESTWDQDGFVVLNGEAELSDLSDLLFAIKKDDNRNISPAAELGEEVSEASIMLEDIRIQTPSPVMQEAEDVIMSVLKLHLGRIQFAQISGSIKPSKEEEASSSSGESSSAILVIVGSLGIDPVLDQSWKLFQQRFVQSGKGWSDSTLCPQEFWSAKIRLESVPPSNPHLALKDLPSDLELTMAEKIARISDGRLELQACGLDLSLLTSTLTRLAEWSQDEVLATPLPLHISLHNVKVQLEDDAAPPPGVPVPPPVDLDIPALTINRNKAGVFTVVQTGTSQPTQPPQDSKSEAERQLELARTEILLLRQKLADQDLREGSLKKETATAQMELASSRKQVSDMILERDSLLNTLNYLQEELLKSGKK